MDVDLEKRRVLSTADSLQQGEAEQEEGREEGQGENQARDDTQLQEQRSQAHDDTPLQEQEGAGCRALLPAEEQGQAKPQSQEESPGLGKIQEEGRGAEDIDGIKREMDNAEGRSCRVGRRLKKEAM